MKAVWQPDTSARPFCCEVQSLSSWELSFWNFSCKQPCKRNGRPGHNSSNKSKQCSPSQRRRLDSKATEPSRHLINAGDRAHVGEQGKTNPELTPPHPTKPNGGLSRPWLIRDTGPKKWSKCLWCDGQNSQAPILDHPALPPPYSFYQVLFVSFSEGLKPPPTWHLVRAEPCGMNHPFMHGLYLTMCTVA